MTDENWGDNWPSSDANRHYERVADAQCIQFDIAQQIAIVAGLIAEFRLKRPRHLSKAIQRLILSVARCVYVGDGDQSESSITVRCEDQTNDDDITHNYTISIPDLFGAKDDVSFIVEGLWLTVPKKQINKIGNRINKWLTEDESLPLNEEAEPADGGEALANFVQAVTNSKTSASNFRDTLVPVFNWVRYSLDAADNLRGKISSSATHHHLEWIVDHNIAYFRLYFNVNEFTRCYIRVDFDDPNGTSGTFIDSLKRIRNRAQSRPNA